MSEASAAYSSSIERILTLMETASACIEQDHPGSKWPDWMSSELTFGQMRFLFILAGDGPMSIGKIAEKFDITLASASGFVDRIEKQGLVERRHRAGDRRVVECALTEEGHRFVAQASGMQREWTSRLLSVLNADELRDMERIVETIVDRLGAPRT